MPENKQEDRSVSYKDSNLMAALSYLWLVSVVMLIVKKDDKFVKFHAKQGTVIFGFSLLVMLLAPIIFFLVPFLWILVLILEIIGFIKALSGEWYKIPVVGGLAEKIKL